MERNLRLYPIYQAARSLLFWLPIFFLYFASAVRPDQVLVLEAIYYSGVVGFEVPSGYFSDRIGRRVTLIIAMSAWLLAAVVFATQRDFESFAIAQLLLAVGMAFNSGTDQALLYDSLSACGREDEFTQRESRAAAVGFVAMAIAAAVGGATAAFDLRLAYVLSGVAAAVAIGIAVSFREPAQAKSQWGPWKQLGTALGRLRDRTLLWLFAVSVVMTVLNHIPYELFQPYLALLLGDPDSVISWPAAASGVTVAAMMVVAAATSRRAARWNDRVGTRALLLGTIALQTAIIAALGAVLHIAVVAVLVLRSVPSAIFGPVAGGHMHPRLSPEIRATYASIQSLVGRLAFSGALLVAADLMGPIESLEFAAMQRVLAAFATVGVVALLIAGATAAAVPGRTRPPRQQRGG